MDIIWTNCAINEYKNVILYLLEEWTSKEAQEFIDNSNSVLSEICITPYMFKASQTHPYMRKGKITKHSSFIYQVDNNEIIILRVIDNRSDELH